MTKFKKIGVNRQYNSASREEANKQFSRSCEACCTMFRCADDIMVRCGCFSGALTDFEKKVKETHGDSKYAKEYLACIETAKIHFGIKGDKDEV